MKKLNLRKNKLQYEIQQPSLNLEVNFNINYYIPRILSINSTTHVKSISKLQHYLFLIKNIVNQVTT